MGQVTEEMKQKASLKIVATLSKWTTDEDPPEQIRQVYNHSLTDACDFILSMAQTNPQHAPVFLALEKDLRHTNWLPLVEDPDATLTPDK